MPTETPAQPAAPVSSTPSESPASSTLNFSSNLSNALNGNSGSGWQLIYKGFGDPLQVIELAPCPLPSLSAVSSTPSPQSSTAPGADTTKGAAPAPASAPDAVLVKMLASCIHPADVNAIMGTYPHKPASFPAVGGFDGVGEVLDVGPGVSSLKKGDLVLPLVPVGVGTWRSYGVYSEEDLIRLDNRLPLLSAATLFTVGGTAYRMLRDFLALEPGDTVIQNAANSACGQAVVQIARHMGLRTLNIVRDRADMDAVRKLLVDLASAPSSSAAADAGPSGANALVLSESEARDAGAVSKLLAANSMRPPRLAFNAVGGKSSLTLARLLADYGTLVTYGGMSQEHVLTPTSNLIFKHLTLNGFWLSGWKLAEQARLRLARQRSSGATSTAAQSSPGNPVTEAELVDRNATMVAELTQLVLGGALKPPSNETFEVHAYKAALSLATKSFAKPAKGTSAAPASATDLSRVLLKPKPILVFT